MSDETLGISSDFLMTPLDAITDVRFFHQVISRGPSWLRFLFFQ